MMKTFSIHLQGVVDYECHFAIINIFVHDNMDDNYNLECNELLNGRVDPQSFITTYKSTLYGVHSW